MLRHCPMVSLSLRRRRLTPQATQAAIRVTPRKMQQPQRRGGDGAGHQRGQSEQLRWCFWHLLRSRRRGERGYRWCRGDACPACSGSGWIAAAVNVTALPEGTVVVSATQIRHLRQHGQRFVKHGQDLTAPVVTVLTPPINATNQATYTGVTGACSESGLPVVVTIGGIATPATAACERRLDGARHQRFRCTGGRGGRDCHAD